MAQDQISRHEILVFRALSKDWITSRDVVAVTGVAPRTARHHLFRFADLGIVEKMDTFPGLSYRMANRLPPQARAYVNRLSRAEEALA